MTQSGLYVIANDQFEASTFRTRSVSRDCACVPCLCTISTERLILRIFLIGLIGCRVAGAETAGFQWLLGGKPVLCA